MMKFVTLSVVAASILACQGATAQFSMPNLLALLTGKVSKEPKQEMQQIPRERSVQLEQNERIETEDKKASLLDTLNLSYAGNMDFSRALNQVLFYFVFREM